MALETLNTQAADVAPTDTDQGTIPFQPAKSTGLTGKLALDPTQTENILANMQKYIDERQGFVPSLAAGINKARAGLAGPSALAAYDRQQQLEDKQIMDYQTQMATFRAAQEKAKNDAAKWSQINAGGAPGGAAGAPGGGIQISAAQKQKEDLAGSDAERIALRQEYLKTMATEGIKAENNPASLTRQPVVVFNPLTKQPEVRDLNMFEYWDLKKKNLIKQPSEYYESQGPAAATPGAANAPMSVRNNNPGNMKDVTTGQMRTFGTPGEGQAALEGDLQTKILGSSPAVKARFGDTGGFLSPAMLAETWAPATAPGNTPESTSNYAKHIASNLGIEPTAQIPKTPESVPVVAKAIKGFESGDLTTTAADLPKGPTVSSQGVQVASAGQGFPDVSNILAQRKIAEEEQMTAAKERGKSGEEKRTAFETDIQPTSIIEDKETNKRIQTLVKENPVITGVLAGPGYAKAIAGQLERGIGNISVNDLSTAILQTLPETSFKTMAERNELATYLARMELKAARMIKGQGQITEGERDILKNASSSIKDPAEAIYKKAKMLERIADLNEELSKIYGDGSGFKNFRTFNQDPRVIDIHKRYQNDLNNILNEQVSFNRGTPGAAPAAGPKEGDTSVSKSGKPTVFKNGKWTYQ